MGLSFPQYVQVKDNYCCNYVGNSPEYVVALRLLKPQIEEQLPGLKFFICCKDDFRYLMEGENQVLYSSELKEKKDNFSYTRELRNSMQDHSVFTLMEESDLQIVPVCRRATLDRGVCLICPEGVDPVKPLNDISKWKKLAENQGYTPVVLGSDFHHQIDVDSRPSGEEKLRLIEDAKWVIGVENEYTMLGAAKGKRVSLDRGIGLRLYQQMFPQIEVI